MYSAAVWLRQVRHEYGGRLEVGWHSFPLEQVNSIQEPGWKLWEQPDDYRSRGLWALRAGKAAGLQGPDAFDKFHFELLKARHEAGRDIAAPEVLRDVAASAGLDGSRFQRDLADRSLLLAIAEDYIRGEEQHGVWGTPTLVFNGDKAAYLKLRPAPPAGDSVKLFVELFDLIHDRPYVLEMKRPR